MFMNKMEKKTEKYPGFMTVDVEEYYHIIGVKGTPPVTAWDSLPARVEIGLNRYFELLAAKEIKATLFFLGYIARKNPGLVRRAREYGHEIASHGMFHREVSMMSSSEFHKDALESRLLLEDISGEAVKGWRSPGFLIPGSTHWFFEKLLEAGYKYDSSVLPLKKSSMGIIGGSFAPCFINCAGGKIYEFPITVVKVLGMNVSMFGGGYLRFFPLKVIARMKDKVLARYPLTIYIHPREIDTEHPHIEMNPLRKFKTYVNLTSVPAKLDMLLDSAKFIRMGDYLDAQE